MRRLLALSALTVATPSSGQAGLPTVAAAPPSRIAVTIYRDPNRRTGQGIELGALRGFALVTETRRVRLPAGPSVVRFEGVSGGIIPVSAVITGLPGGTIEKNRDARLLSPAALIDGTLGQQVTLRRTNRATGEIREEEATIVAGPARGVVLRTASGVEALGCSGLPEKAVYSGVPAGLSARPVLSVTTRSPRATTATITLTYLASAFDWSASYVATLAPGGESLDLFAWTTLANGNAEALPDAEVNVVAGRVNRRYVEAYRAAAARLSLSCFPLGTTTSGLSRPAASEEIVVTGSRMMAESMMRASAPPPPPPPAPPPPPEDLGDLKLYRVPMRVEVAAKQQKQVALLSQKAVPFDRVYRAQVFPRSQPAAPVAVELRMRNVAERGLGIALPSGTTALYQQRGGERLLLGLGQADDTAVGQRFRIAAGNSPQVLLQQTIDGLRRATITLSNANAAPVTVEVRIGSPGATDLAGFSSAVERVEGVWTWTATVPENATASLSYDF